MSNENCLCMNLRAAAQSLTRTYDAALAPAGVTANQFSLMNHIRTGDAPNIQALATASGLDRSTLGRNLRVLEREGLISMAIGSDARSREIALTPEGRRTIRRAAPLWSDVQETLSARLGNTRRAELRVLLEELTAEI